MDMVMKPVKMEINTKVIIRKIKSMVLENLKEKMIVNILVIGKMVNPMDKERLNIKI